MQLSPVSSIIGNMLGSALSKESSLFDMFAFHAENEEIIAKGEFLEKLQKLRAKHIQGDDFKDPRLYGRELAQLERSFRKEHLFSRFQLKKELCFRIHEGEHTSEKITTIWIECLSMMCVEQYPKMNEEIALWKKALYARYVQKEIQENDVKQNFFSSMHAQIKAVQGSRKKKCKYLLINHLVTLISGNKEQIYARYIQRTPEENQGFEKLRKIDFVIVYLNSITKFLKEKKDKLKNPLEALDSIQEYTRILIEIKKIAENLSLFVKNNMEMAFDLLCERFLENVKSFIQVINFNIENAGAFQFSTVITETETAITKIVQSQSGTTQENLVKKLLNIANNIYKPVEGYPFSTVEGRREIRMIIETLSELFTSHLQYMEIKEQSNPKLLGILKSNELMILHARLTTMLEESKSLIEDGNKR